MLPAQVTLRWKGYRDEREATSTQELNTLEPIYCPQTGKRIVAESHKQFDIPSGRVTWFHCEACRGWHIVIDNANPLEFLHSISQD